MSVFTDGCVVLVAGVVGGSGGRAGQRRRPGGEVGQWAGEGSDGSAGGDVRIR